MISAPIHDMTGKEVGTYEFDPADLAPGINKQLLHDAVVMYESNRRVGTVKTKSRAVVAGSKKKMYRQKGTGRARAGNRRTPVRRGGGHAFAKVPKDWSYRMPKKAIRLATRMALLSKFQDGEAIVVDNLALTESKTRIIVAMLKALGVNTQTCLLTIAAANSEIWQSARNISTVLVAPAAELNAYDLLRQKRLVITREAIDQLRGKE
jgi:large subunit ribosomal protein L4